jgi:CheY-like chemotaxis protein
VRAIEEPDAELRFELADLFADGRLRHVQTLRSRYRDEVPEVSEFHAGTVAGAAQTRHTPSPDRIVRFTHPPRRARCVRIIGMPCRVLVVDDDAAFRELASDLLGRLGLDVAGEAGTFADGAAAAGALRPDAALVDVGLPDGDGVELARRISALPWAPRVVITSSDADAVTGDGAQALGAVAFLPKTELADGRLRAYLTGVP